MKNNFKKPKNNLMRNPNDNLIDKDVIFSDGVYLSPIKIILNEKETWAWVATGFEGQNFYDGVECMPRIFADKYEKLLRFDEDDFTKDELLHFKSFA
ncbi:MAG: hypothetical protein A2046_00860 [Bacteroidetes bacterium GWA2_30_7]|nr:MAG: hypothetical protein A2046_00860 [Bacteroidetes bacterium GWA2_30_7]